MSKAILLDNSDENADWIKSAGAVAEAHDPGTITYTRNGIN